MEAGCFRYNVFARIALRKLDPFEALAEISRFVAGLVQRVPKKPNIAKADLLNSTASQDDQLANLKPDKF